VARKYQLSPKMLERWRDFDALIWPQLML